MPPIPNDEANEREIMTASYHGEHGGAPSHDGAERHEMWMAEHRSG
jgi:hypothetical protein